MSYLYGAFLAEDYCNHVEAKRAVLNVVGCKKIAGGLEQSGFLGRRDGGFNRAESFVRLGSDLDKYDGAVGSYHNQVDFAGLAGEVAREGFEAFSFEEPLAAFFTPSAEQFAVGQQLAFVQEQISYPSLRLHSG